MDCTCHYCITKKHLERVEIHNLLPFNLTVSWYATFCHLSERDVIELYIVVKWFIM